MFIVDVSKEHIAVREAQRLEYPCFGMVDTNSDPSSIDFPIPANDDASKSIKEEAVMEEDIDKKKYEAVNIDDEEDVAKVSKVKKTVEKKPLKKVIKSKE
jgi:small subunit ribosomal protein S2